MSTTSFAVLLGLFSALFGALANLLARRAMGFARSRDFLSFNFAVIFLLLAPAAPWLAAVNGGALTWVVLIATAALDGLANFCYFKSFEHGEVVTASSLLALAPLFTLLLQPLWLFAPPAFSLGQAGGVALITAGTLLLARSLAGGSAGGARRTGALVYPLLAAVLFGFSILPARWLLLENRTTPYTFFFLRAGVISLLSALLWRPRLGWLRPPQAALTAGRAALVICQWLLMLTALQMDSPAPVKAVSETTPLFVVLLAVAFLHEKVTLPRGLGAAAITLGIMLLV